MESNVNDNLYFILVTGSLAMAVLAGIVVSVVIYYQKRRIKYQNELQSVQLQHQLELLQNSITVQEMERKRFAEDLHDDAGALLSAVKLNLHRITQGNSPLVDETRELLDTAMNGIRRVSHDLSPPGLEEFGVWPVLTDLVQKLGTTAQVQVSCDLSAVEQLRLIHQAEVSVYRIVSEWLNNTVRHGAATQIKLKAWVENGWLCVLYQDNGKGFELENMNRPTGAGMKNIESRTLALGGRLTISTAPGKGFEAKIDLPSNK